MYYTYMLRCADGSIYTGITTDIKRRLREHSGERAGAKYTKGHTPLKIEAAWESEDRSRASSLEYVIKRLTKEKKESLIKNNDLFDEFVGDKINTKEYNAISDKF